MRCDYHVLIVDAKERDIQTVHSMLSRDRSLNFHVQVCDTLKKTESMLLEENFDIVLCGLSLENPETVKSIRTFPAVYNIPIIVCFNAGEEVHIKQNRLSEFADCIPKHSLNPIVLGKSIQFALEKSALMRRLTQAEQSLRSLTTRDPVTNLPNRNMFFELTCKEIFYSERNKSQFAMLNIVVNNIRHISNSVGYKQAERIMVEIANRLQKRLRKVDTVARICNDEFGILLPDIKNSQAVNKVTESILECFTRSIVVNDTELFLSVNIGIATYPLDGADSDLILKNAQLAALDARQWGINNYRFYCEDINQQNADRLALENDLRKAIERNEFEIYYQPLFDSAHRRIIAAEALLRWRHPVKGLRAPEEFITAAEEHGLIESIGQWVLLEACRQNKKWQQAGYPYMRVAVNVSAKQFAQPQFVETIKTILQETRLDPQWLELELTENVFIKNMQHSLETLNSLRELGIRVSIDDFGTGYSSLSYLKQLPVDSLKIDRSFVQDVLNVKDNAIIRAIVTLAQNLNIETVAEGIETAEQHCALKEMGCNYIQGFLFQKPMQSNRFSFLLQKHAGGSQYRFGT